MVAFHYWESFGHLEYMILAAGACAALLIMSVIVSRQNRARTNKRLAEHQESVLTESILNDKSERQIRHTKIHSSDEKADLDTSEAQAVASALSESKREHTVLVADDDPVVILALSKRLKRLGFNVIQSPDAAHALMGVMKIVPDLIILDVNMPSGNGLAVAEMLASDPRYVKIPVIIYSVLDSETVKERCKKLGAWYIEKSPRAWLEINSLLECLFGKPQLDVDSTGAITAEVESEEPKSESANTAADVRSESKSTEEKGFSHLVPLCGHSRLLCIDSEECELDMVVNRLAGLGAEVIRLHDLEEGFWSSFTEKPHAIIIEWAKKTPKLAEILNRFIIHPFTKKIPLIFINREKNVAISELPHGEQFVSLPSPIAWHDFLAVLERYVPISSPQVEDPMAVPHPLLREREESAEGPGCETLDAAEPVATSPLRFLCIDDDPVIAQSIAVRMKPYGIEVKSAPNGMAGYLQAVGEVPDAVLLDLQLPNGDGNYVLAKLKEHPRTKNIPVVILTVETNRGVRRQLIAQGASGFLSKPVRWNALFDELENHVDLPKKLLVDYRVLPQAIDAN
jgi:CheY-like chemotaxis protein